MFYTLSLTIGPATGPVPSKPRQFQATKIESQSVKVQWREPLTTNGDIVEYFIHVQEDGAER